jgi:two-component system, NarL family, invasion response regulator UvrY
MARVRGTTGIDLNFPESAGGLKILLVDDHSIVRSGLRRLFAELPGVKIIEAGTGPDALTLAREERPTLILLDLSLPGLGGFELLRRLLDEHPGGKVIVLSMHTEGLYATRALRAGAAGYFSKNGSPEELLEAVQRVLSGGRYVEAAIAQTLAIRSSRSRDPIEQLTDRDLDIMCLLCNGQSLSDIAATLDVTYKTIANTCTQIKAKLGVARTTDLVWFSIENGVI